MKNPKPFVIPLPGTALDLFRELEEITGTNAYVLASHKDPEKTIDRSSLQHTLGRLITSENEKRAKKNLDPIEHAVPHDLRRTFRTLITEKCAVQPHVAELCLGHSLGGIFATYDTGSYYSEREAALQQWDDYLSRIIKPDNKVVELERSAV